MHDIICFDQTTRHLFDEPTLEVLDLLQERFARVEIEPPIRGRSPVQWFAQVYREGNESVPEGFYGSTALEAASRIANALGVKSS
jgi:hypothetical protein